MECRLRVPGGGRWAGRAYVYSSADRNDFVESSNILSPHADTAVRGRASDRILVVGPVDVDEALEGVLIFGLQAAES